MSWKEPPGRANVYHLLNSQMCHNMAGKASPDDRLVFEPELDLVGRPSDTSARVVHACLNKTYWSRIWVILWFFRAKDTHLWCGSHQSSLANFQSHFSHYGKDRSRLLPFADCGALNRPGKTFFQYRSLWRQMAFPSRNKNMISSSTSDDRPGFGLCEVFMVFSKSKCTERLDKVYAYLNWLQKHRIRNPSL